MKIGIIGSAAVGQTLAAAFNSEGHQVMLGSRNPSKEEVVKFKNENASIQTGTFDQTAQFGELLVLATKGSAAMHALELAGKQNISDKVIIDATNPIAAAPPVNGVLSFSTSINYSMMEELQQAFPEAKFVKAFNSVGNLLMYKPQLPATPTMFICGNNDAAKKQVSDILISFGWEVEDCGKAEAARAIEPLSMLWCIAGFLQNDWMHAFKVLRPK